MDLSLREVVIDAEQFEQTQRFAHSFFASMGIKNFEQRQSESYVDGVYWLGVLNDFGVKVATLDQDTSSQRRFSVCVTNKYGIPARCTEIEEKLKAFLINSGRRFFIED